MREQIEVEIEDEVDVDVEGGHQLPLRFSTLKPAQPASCSLEPAQPATHPSHGSRARSASSSLTLTCREAASHPSHCYRTQSGAQSCTQRMELPYVQALAT